MQKIAFKALVFSMALAFVSCSEDENNSAPFLQIEKKSVDLRESGLFSRDIPILTNAKEFEMVIAESGKDASGEYWCSARVEGNLLVIEALENKLYPMRETDITVKAKGSGLSETIHVRQFGKEAIIMASTKMMPVSILHQTIEIDVTSNVEYTIASPEWIQEVPGVRAPETLTTTCRFQVDVNDALEGRIDTIYFTQKDIEGNAKVEKVVIRQGANIPPPAIEGLRALSNVKLINSETIGSITLYWNAFPEGSNIRAVEVTYTDPVSGEVVVEESLPADTSYTVSNTMRKHGEYSFSVRSISVLDVPAEPSAVKAVSKPLPHVPGPVTGETQLVLKDRPLSSNAQEPSEGPIANLVDGNTAGSSFFHSRWSGTVPPAPHWFQIDLGTTLSDHFRIKTTPRNASNIPVDFDLLGSEDGVEWFFIKNFTQVADNIPTKGNGSPFISPSYRIMEGFNHIRMVVKATNTGTIFFSMSEFEIWDVKTAVVSDPEATK